jgi:hypothetical protein
MPIQKFRSIDEMPGPLRWYVPGDPALYRAINSVLRLARQLAPQRFAPGVEKFRSFDEMARIQDARDAEFVRGLYEQRAASRETATAE